jgi:hypothetical protein
MVRQFMQWRHMVCHLFRDRHDTDSISLTVTDSTIPRKSDSFTLSRYHGYYVDVIAQVSMPGAEKG